MSTQINVRCGCCGKVKADTYPLQVGYAPQCPECRADPSNRMIDCKHGEDRRMQWTTVDGTHYEGVVVDTDSNVLYVRLDDGRVIPVEAQ